MPKSKGDGVIELDINKACECYRRGLTLKQTAAVCGMSHVTLLKRLKENPEYKEKLLEAKAVAIGAVAGVLFEMAVKDKEAWAVKYYLSTVGGFSDKSNVNLNVTTKRPPKSRLVSYERS